jgi:excisionase family DNA binding protein
MSEKTASFNRATLVVTSEPATSGRDVVARLLTAEEVSTRLGVPSSWVKKAARAGRIPSVRVGRYRRFHWQDIEAWLAQERACG